MSISAKNTAPEDEDFAEIEFRPRPVHKEQTEAATPTSEQEAVATPATQEPTEQTTKPAAEEQAAPPAKKKSGGKKKGGCLSTGFDAMLVIILLVILGGGGYYVKQQMDLYRVPSPLEIALQENNRLQQQRDALSADYYRADEQLVMTKSLEHLDSELSKIKSESREIENSIADRKNNILAMQHEIRTADKENRSIALSMLPGMPLGNVTTTRGRSFKNAYIYRMEGKLMTIRFPEGQVRLPISELIKKGLPTMVNYALGEEELVDMSDFDSNGDAPATSAPESNAPVPAPSTTEIDYEQNQGTPVVDTSAGTPVTAPINLPSVNGNSWAAPTGDLPM